MATEILEAENKTKIFAKLSDWDVLHLLDFARLFTEDKKSSIREKYRDVFVDNLGIKATNGHILCKIECRLMDYDLPNKITVKSIKDAVKVKKLSLLENSGNTEEIQDLDRLIPVEYENQLNTRLNCGYLASIFTGLNKLQLSFHKKFPIVDIISISNNNGNIFKCEIYNSDNEVVFIATILVMPVRN